VRVVLDPSVIAAAAISRDGACATLLREFRAGAFELVASPTLFDEVEGLLQRPALRRHVSDGETVALLGLVRQESAVLDDPPSPHEPALAEDPEDGYLVALARAGSARALVSADPHLTRLAGRLPILTPAEFVLLLE
jgi:putative PIN family toxin of toxin-antitoxin system